MVYSLYTWGLSRWKGWYTGVTCDMLGKNELGRDETGLHGTKGFAQ